MLPAAFYQQPTLELARDLLGRQLVRSVQGHSVTCRIVEVEAYHQDGDAAAHSYRGKTRRNAVIFGPAGFLYVYFIYGIHYCMNVVSEAEGVGAAVLIRALEPVAGAEHLIHRPKRKSDLPTNGPAKCCKALAVDRALDGASLLGGQIWLAQGAPVTDAEVVQTTRIGISKSVELPWRFYLKNNPYVSKK